MVILKRTKVLFFWYKFDIFVYPGIVHGVHSEIAYLAKSRLTECLVFGEKNLY